jgi:hypothetical protein
MYFCKEVAPRTKGFAKIRYRITRSDLPYKNQK